MLRLQMRALPVQTNCFADMPEARERAPKEHADSSGQPRSVHVRFPHVEGQRLRCSEPTNFPGEEPLWTRRPVLMERADGTYELIGTSRNLEGLARWILSFGTNAEAKGPSQLRQQVAAEARRVWRQYEDK